jgi:menaquinone-dependent protoporphyrinogen oxidase
MGRILILFATIDGQTARIADHMAEVLRSEGHKVVTRPARVADAADDTASFDGVIVGCGIRYGSYAKYLAPIVQRSVAPLGTPTAFFSVCLSADGPGAKPATAKGYVDAFLCETAWRPLQVESFGGALLYRRYNPFTRFMMRMISGIAGGETDTTRDYEYTDWEAVAGFAREFSARVATRSRHELPMELAAE